MISETNFYNPVMAAPYIPPLPEHVMDVQNCKILLTDREKDDWRFLFKEIDNIPLPDSKVQDFDFSVVSSALWQCVSVPGSLIMQGFDIENNKEYYYQREIEIPPDFSNQRIFLRFEGVYSNARVWINDKFIAMHCGGFTVWDCDISAFRNETSLTLTIGVSDIEGDTRGVWNPNGEYQSNSAWASYYAHCNIGGIIRNITMFVVPETYIARTHINTTVKNNDFNRWSLTADMEICGGDLCQKEIEFCLLCKEKTIFTAKSAIPGTYANGGKCCFKFTQEVEKPLLWDAEHPNLYSLCITLTDEKNAVLQKNRTTVGFRHISYGGADGTAKNKMYVNGKEIKLRGVCRHDVSAKYGRSLTDAEILHELNAYKANNINFVRTSHYPACEKFVDLCDALGIYVEQENAACFKGANDMKIYNPPEDFVKSFAEMVETSRNHPSVIIWSLANESGFEESSGFRDEFNYIKAADKTRPVIFSYPLTVKSKPLPYDIFSCHYKKVTSALGRKDMPVLHDEFAHIPCYNLDELRHENSSRYFWGESIQKGWASIFKTEGALGCALWSAIDDVFFLPDGTTERHQFHAKGRAAGYGEWGAILDAYGREKPEAFLTKKAFSPIWVDSAKYMSDTDIQLHLFNRFDHTNLDEIKAVCLDEDGNTVFSGNISEKILPHTRGGVRFSCSRRPVRVQFYSNGIVLEEYVFSDNKTTQGTGRGSRTTILVNPRNGISITDETGKALISQIDVCVGNTTETVCASNVKRNGETVTAKYKIKKPHIKCIIKMRLCTDRIEVTMRVKSPLFSRVLNKPVSLCLHFNDAVNSVSWARNALYTNYPETHIARPAGKALRTAEHDSAADKPYYEAPCQNWEDDMQNHFLFTEEENKRLLCTNDFRTKRNHIIDFAAQTNSFSLHIKAKSEGVNCFVDTQKEDMLLISLGAYYPDIAWGNYFGQIKSLNKEIKFALYFKQN